MDTGLSSGRHVIAALSASTSLPPPDVTGGRLRQLLDVSPWMIFAALTLLALALRLACTTGLIGSDDLIYAKYARALMEGHYSETLDQARVAGRIHWAFRFGVVVPLAGLYKAFGVTEWSTLALPLLASTASVLLLAAVGRRMFDMRVAVIAGLLYATFPLQLRYGTAVLPEPIAECFALLGVLCYVTAPRRGDWTLVAAGALMGVAYLAKESAVFIGGAFFLHAVWERRWRSAALLATGMTGVIAAEHVYHLFAHGDLLFRMHSTRLFNLEASAIDPDRYQDLSYLLFRKYPHMMIVPNLVFGLHSLACVVCAGAALAMGPRRQYSLLLLWAAIPWLYLSFGSWSLQQYALIPRDPRYIEFTYPPLMLLSGVAISRALAARPLIARSAALALALVAGAGIVIGVGMRGTSHTQEKSMRSA